MIDGSRSDKILLGEQYEGGPFGYVQIDAELKIPQSSFTGTEELTMTIFPEEGTVEFGPSMVFNRDLKFTLEFTGIDLTNVDTNTVKFCYIDANGSFVETENNGIVVNLGNGKLKVMTALIPHFSRYGFVN